MCINSDRTLVDNILNELERHSNKHQQNAKYKSVQKGFNSDFSWEINLYLKLKVLKDFCSNVCLFDHGLRKNYLLQIFHPNRA